MNTLDLDGKIREVEVEEKWCQFIFMSKYQLSIDSRWGLVLGGEDSKSQSMEIGKFRCKVHLGAQC